MPRQNRVTPFGEIVAVAERGTCLGNRGVLHDEEGHIRRQWQGRRWILCRLTFKGRHREIMAPNRYTELFFQDEATGLAAGHRPCAECRRDRFNAFRDAWIAGNDPSPEGNSSRATAIDDRLHAERVGPDHSKRTYRANLDALPDGVFVTFDDSSTTARLIQGEELLSWTPGGYKDRRLRPRGGEVTVLTPESTVAAIRAGFTPEVRSSGCEKGTEGIVRS